MTNEQFWIFLATGWSTLQEQAKSSKFDSVLLEKVIQAQVSNAKAIRNNYYVNDGFLAYADDDENDIY
ncbi:MULTISPECIES: hypothetical protein [Lysinibacillus]|uniref:Uncharacterized protein n=1 Tax=Lysinibacillus capsici TaxID=2115968 RepID=A0ABY8KMH0_9BACI|nr:hypothetical protein [Lysinibacillus capsici]WGF40660.1 hypothetical protein QBO96_10595 [Lysinibacillus capsici]